MRRSWLVVAVVILGACRTVGVSTTDGGFAEVSSMIANEMIVDTDQVVVIDVRSAEAYSEGHIPGALNAPFDSIEQRLPELLPYRGRTVLVYGATSTDGAVGARVLAVAGFRNVVHVTGGIRAWIERGYSTVNGR